jgi:glycosyltransferase involved in cell wall biosynthesis
MDVFYHPSRNEGLPLAVLEASVLSVPLVVSKYTNMTEYVSAYNAGICLLENTAHDIAHSMEQVEKLYYSNTLKVHGINARRMADENFDWKIIAKKILNAYAV